MDRISKNPEGSVYLEDMFNHCDNNDFHIWMEALNFKSTLKVESTAAGVVEREGSSRSVGEDHNEVGHQISPHEANKRTIDDI